MTPTEQTDPSGWRWDPTLYAGSARFYPIGRVPYPAQVASVLADALGLDGSGRLLDVGCGPGSLTLLLAPHFASVLGLDADADMLAQAARLAGDQQIGNASWRHLRAEELPADLPRPDVVTLAQSFHWMERERVASIVRGMLLPDGVVVHVSANTDSGVDPTADLPHPRPPWPAVVSLVKSYLGGEKRAGQSVRPTGPAADEDEVYRAAGFAGPERLEVAGRVVTRTVDEVVATVYSLSSSASHLFGDRLGRFEVELRQLLQQASPARVFSEQMRSVALDLWR